MTSTDSILGGKVKRFIGEASETIGGRIRKFKGADELPIAKKPVTADMSNSSWDKEKALAEEAAKRAKVAQQAKETTDKLKSSGATPDGHDYNSDGTLSSYGQAKIDKWGKHHHDPNLDNDATGFMNDSKPGFKGHGSSGNIDESIDQASDVADNVSEVADQASDVADTVMDTASDHIPFAGFANAVSQGHFVEAGARVAVAPVKEGLAAAAAAEGAAIGQAVIPIPGLGAVIGGAVGYLGTKVLANKAIRNFFKFFRD